MKALLQFVRSFLLSISMVSTFVLYPQCDSEPRVPFGLQVLEAWSFLGKHG